MIRKDFTSSEQTPINSYSRRTAPSDAQGANFSHSRVEVLLRRRSPPRKSSPKETDIPLKKQTGKNDVSVLKQKAMKRFAISFALAAASLIVSGAKAGGFTVVGPGGGGAMFHPRSVPMIRARCWLLAI